MILPKFIPPVIAHRGASGYAPENTLSAFIKAAQLGINWVEFDVMLTQDKVAIVFHDNTLSRTTNGLGKVSRKDYAYLASLDAGKWFDSGFSGQRIPCLEQVLQFLYENRMHANIEIKTPTNQMERFIPQLLEITAPYKQRGVEYLYSSFSHENLTTLRKYDSLCHIGLLLHRWQAHWQSLFYDLNCVSVHVNQRILTQEKVREIKKMNALLLAYTVNDPIRAQLLMSWGVDAVFSDFPDRMLPRLADL